MMARRGRVSRFLLLFLVVMPIIEVIVIILVGRAIGGWQTFGLLVLLSLVGSWLVKSQWRTAWRSLSTATRTGRAPAKELTDTALVLAGGLLLMLPGFVTGVLGLLLVLPFTRPLARPLVQAAVARRVLAGSGFVTPGMAGFPGGRASGPPRTDRASGSAGDQVIEGEIVDEG